MSYFRKKPVVIEAFLWTGCIDQTEDPDWVIKAIEKKDVYFSSPDVEKNTLLLISTLEGVMTAQPGDWVIKGVQGEIYPCKPDIFKQTYEAFTPSPTV